MTFSMSDTDIVTYN